MYTEVTSSEEQRVAHEMVNICADRHDAVIGAQTFNATANTILARSEQGGSTLEGELELLLKSSQSFLDGCADWRSRRQVAVQSLGASSKIQDLIDLPQTLENCVRAEAFHEASLILDFISSLRHDHPELKIVRTIGDSCESVLSQTIATVSLPRLSQTLSLPTTMKLVNFLRRVGFTDEEIRLVYLDNKAHAVDAELQDSSAVAHSPYSRVCKLIGEFKVHITDTVSQFTACFGGVEAASTELAAWVQGRSVVFLPIVHLSLASIHSGSELTSLVDQAVHLSAILAPIGADIGDPLRLLIELRAVQLFQSHVQAAFSSYQTALETFSTTTTTTSSSARPSATPAQGGGGGPLQEVLSYIPLSYLLNGILMGCNEIRKCAFDGIALQCISTLEIVLKQVMREGVVLEADAGYKRALSSIVIPHVVSTLKTLFPVFAADTRVYDGLVSLTIES